MSDAHRMVSEFHDVFDVSHLTSHLDLRILRATLIEEEAYEVTDALCNEPLESVAKELADLVYVTYGAAIALGIDLDEAIRRVHVSNMTKRNPDGSITRRQDGKVLKPATYEPPSMEGVVIE